MVRGEDVESGRVETGVRTGGFECDLGSLPILWVRSPSAADCDAIDSASFFAGVDQALALRRPFAILHDLRCIPPVSALTRMDFVKEVRVRKEQVVEWVAAYAAVASSPMERGVVTAIAWFSGPPLPVRLFEQPEDAEAWLRQRLDAFEPGSRDGSGSG